MGNSLPPSSSKLPISAPFAPIGHKDYRSLPFTQQLEIVRLYQFENDRYMDLCYTGGYLDQKKKGNIRKGKLAYIHNALDYIQDNHARHPPLRKTSLPIGVQCAVAGYNTNYMAKWSKTDRRLFNIIFRKIVNIGSFNLPLLTLDPFASKAIRIALSAFKNVPQDRVLRIALTTVAHCVRSGMDDTEALTDALTDTAQSGIPLSLEGINKIHRVIEDDDWHHIARTVNDPTQLPRGNTVRFALLEILDKDDFDNYFYPLVPQWWYFRQVPRFTISSWGFLR